MTLALRAEWIKLRSVQSTTWALVALFGLTVLISALVGASAQTDGCPHGQTGCDDDVVMNSLAGVYLGQFAVAALAVLAITSEYATGTIRTTFTALPRRRAVLAAKAATLGGLVLAAGVITAAVAYLAGRSLLAGNGYTEFNGYPEAPLTDLLRPLLGTGLYLTALALLCLGVAAVLRHTAAAITTVLALLWVPVFAPALLPASISDQVIRFAPMTAGLTIQRTVERPDSVPIDPWAGLGVAWLYAAAALALAFWLIRRRDA
jgi:ABC-2 type transport system permease protein